jgi:DNA-binding response OmpR family regulator
MLNEPIRVLIVDGALQRDERIDEILASAGFETRVVNDGGSATGALDVWKPAVAVVDLRQPSSEARRFCIDLAERPTADVAVVLIAEGSNLLKPTLIVPDGLVSTPVNPDLLIATVRRVTRETADAMSGATASL